MEPMPTPLEKEPLGPDGGGKGLKTAHTCPIRFLAVQIQAGEKAADPHKICTPVRSPSGRKKDARAAEQEQEGLVPKEIAGGFDKFRKCPV